MHRLEKLLLKLSSKDPKKHYAQFEAVVLAILAFHQEGVSPEGLEEKAEGQEEMQIPTLNPIGANDKTPLMNAASLGHKPYIELLLKKNADVCLEIKGDSALVLATAMANASSWASDVDSVQLIQEAYRTQFEKNGATGNYEAIKAILKSKHIGLLPPDILMVGLNAWIKDPNGASFESKMFFALTCLSHTTDDNETLSNFIESAFAAINHPAILSQSLEGLKASERIRKLFKTNIVRSIFSSAPSSWEKLKSRLDILSVQIQTELQNKPQRGQILNKPIPLQTSVH